jgi:hypothetical protein
MSNGAVLVLAVATCSLSCACNTGVALRFVVIGRT